MAPELDLAMEGPLTRVVHWAFPGTQMSLLERQARTPAEKLRKTFGPGLQKLIKFNNGLHSEEARDYAKNFAPRPSDVFVVTYPKSGTTWLSNIAHQIRSNCSMEFDEIDEVVPFDIAAQECGQDLDAEQGFLPRLFKSHLPSEQIARGGRYVFLVREPRAVLVSLWRYFCQGVWPTYAGFKEGDVSLRAFTAGIFASYRNSGVWGQIVSWYRCCWADRATLWLTYEDLLESPAQSIQQLAEFLLPDLHDVLSKDPALLERVRASTTKEFMLRHKERFDEHFVLKCLEPFKTGASLDSKPYMNKVQPPPVGTPGGIIPDGEVAALLDSRWARIVEPATGFRTYAELRAAIGGRANWTAEDFAAASVEVVSRRHSRDERQSWLTVPLLVLALVGLLALGRRRRWGPWAVDLVQRTLHRWRKGGSVLPRASADKAARVSSGGPAGLRRRRGEGDGEGEEECADGELREKAKGWHAPSRAAVALALGLALTLAVALAFWGLAAPQGLTERDVRAARALCRHWHPAGECRAPLADMAEEDRAALVVSCFSEDLRWLEDAPRGRESAWVYMHNHSGQQQHRGGGLWSGRGGGGPRTAEGDAGAVRAALEDQGAARFVDIPNVGDEATAYLRYLVDQYNALPEVVVFSHGHQSSQRHARFDMAELLKCLCTDAEPAGEPAGAGGAAASASRGEPGGPARAYRSLNSGISGEPMCFRMEGEVQKGARRDRLDEPRGIIRKHWATYFAPFFGATPPAVFCMDCCAQFLVSRDEVRAHPREMYEALLTGVLSRNVTGLEMEIFWRLLFVGPEEAVATAAQRPELGHHRRHRRSPHGPGARRGRRQ